MKDDEIVNNPAILNVESIEDKFDKAIDKQIDDYLDNLNLEGLFSNNKLVTAEMKRVQIKNDLIEEIRKSDKSKEIFEAIYMLKSKDLNLLEDKEYWLLMSEFERAGNILEGLDPNHIPVENFQKILSISDESMQSIMKVAVAKFVSQNYNDSLLLYNLLSTLAPDNPEFRFRLGLVAQQSGKIDLALSAYLATADIIPKFLGAKLFAIECYLDLGYQADAQIAFREAEKIADNEGGAPEWRKFYKELKAKGQWSPPGRI